ncbi:MAG: hypothetical protein KAW92_12350 [Candidatus Cloacimonetes bacterium]|nr:hypothetical protein [Candidatus Cloacimonadota bacterium]
MVFVKKKSKEDRVTYFCLEFELESIIRRKRLKNLCKKYNHDQILFEEEPRLTDYIRVKGSKKHKPENELIDYKVLLQLHKSEIIKFKDIFTKLSLSLNPRIPDWSNENFPSSAIFVRINPDIVSYEGLPQLLTEEIQIKPEEIDWNAYQFSNRLLQSQEYILSDIPLSQSIKMEYWDFNIKGIKTIQFSTSKKGNYRSFMIEELNDKYNSDNILIGKCIHLDSKYFIDTNLNEQEISHLDLAINIYEDSNRKKRLSESLINGKISDADYRIHLFRIEDIPLKTLPIFCLFFLIQFH